MVTLLSHEDVVYIYQLSGFTCTVSIMNYTNVLVFIGEKVKTRDSFNVLVYRDFSFHFSAFAGGNEMYVIFHSFITQF